MILDSNSRRPNIEYPVNWGYKVIGENVDKLIAAIEESVKGFEYEITPSNISTGGKYYSLNLNVLVESEVIRDLIFQKLEEHPHIKMVI